VLKRLLLILGACILLSAGSGCAVGMWTADRANDFVDMFGVRLSGNMGIGLEANVRATEVFQTGLGWSEKYVVGFKGRDYGVYKEQSYSLPFVPSDWVPWVYPSPFGTERSVNREPVNGTFKPVNSSRQVFFGAPSDIVFVESQEETKYERHYDEVGFSAYALMVGIEAEVRLLEVLDFAVGMVTFGIADIMSDDLFLKEYMEKNKSSRPKKVPRPIPKTVPKKTSP